MYVNFTSINTQAHTNVYSHNSRGQKFYNHKAAKSAFLLGALEKNSYLLLPASRVTVLLWPLSGNDIPLTSASVITSPSLTLTLLPPSVRTPWLHWTHLDNPGYSLLCKILNPPAKSLLPYKVIHWQALGSRIWTTLRGDFSIYPSPLPLQWIPFLT